MSEPHVPQTGYWDAESSVIVSQACTEINRLRQTNVSTRRAIDRSLAHLREMYAFLEALELRSVKPAVYIEGHPICCGVPMWLTKVQIAADLRCGHYTCQVCGKMLDGINVPALWSV